MYEIKDEFRDGLNRFFQAIYNSEPLPVSNLGAKFTKQNAIKKEIVQDILNKSKENHISLKKMVIKYMGMDLSLNLYHETLRKYIRGTLFKTFKKPDLIVERRKKIIYIDEVTFDTNHKSYMRWVSMYEDDDIVTAGRFGTVKMIMAISDDDVISYEIVNKTTNSDKFVNFLQNLLPKIKDMYQKSGMNWNEYVCLYMDNASIHSTNKVKEFLIVRKVEVIFGIPYYPILNPIEKVFQDMKIQFYRRIIMSRGEIISFIDEIVPQIARITLYKKVSFMIKRMIKITRDKYQQGFQLF